MSNGNNNGLSTIASRYATALMELGEKYNQLDVFNSDMNIINQTFVSYEDLSKFLSHPTIAINEKKEIIDKIFRDTTSPIILNTLKLLLDRNRFFLFSSIANHYKMLLFKKRNILVAEVSTAIEINEEIKDRVKNQLEKLFNKNITLEHKVKPEIIAGMIIKIGDKVIDGSIKSKFETMKRKIM